MPARIVDEGARHQEQTHLDGGVEQHMEQSAQGAFRSQEEQTHQGVGDLTDGGVGQTLFEHLFPVGHHGAHKHRQQGQGQPGLLHPGAPEEVCAYGEIDHPDDGQHAGLGNDAGEHGGGGGGSHGMGGGQPAVEGVHTGLGAEAHHTQEDHNLNQGFVAGQLFRIQRAAGDKIHGGCILGQEENAAQSQKSACHRIEQVFQRAPHRFLGAVMEHQGHGQQGNHLEEQVHGDEVPGEIHAHQRRLGQQEEGEEPFLLFFVLQIAEGIDAGEQEAERGDDHKEFGDAVQP